MNLNPLKKDDNTDALVKALEDANNADAPAAGSAAQVAAVPQAPGADNTLANDASLIAADPQITGMSDTATNDLLGDSPVSADDNTSPSMPTVASLGADLNTSLTDGSSDSNATSSEPAQESMPVGLSSDADAHLETESDDSDNSSSSGVSLSASSDPVSEGTGDNSEIDSVKKDALEALRPLIEKLDLSPAEKFDKYLMMLRASDDPALIKPAYEAAAQIEGDKEKAQALLDVINEINYITSNK